MNATPKVISPGMDNGHVCRKTPLIGQTKAMRWPSIVLMLGQPWYKLYVHNIDKELEQFVVDIVVYV